MSAVYQCFTKVYFCIFRVNPSNLRHPCAFETASPSAVNSLIDCSLQFYFRYIADFAKKDELSDELDNNILGSIVHRTIELIYRQIPHLQPLIVPKEQKCESYFEKFVVHKEQIERYQKNKILIDKLLEMAFEIEFFARPTPKNTYNGGQLIYFNAAKRFVERLLEYDKQNSPIEIYGMEHWRQIPYQISENISVNIGVFVDRIHLKDNDLYIVDYKTSKKLNSPKSIEQLFDGTDDNRAKYVLQAFFYSLIFAQQFSEKTLCLCCFTLQIWAIWTNFYITSKSAIWLLRTSKNICPNLTRF